MDKVKKTLFGTLVAMVLLGGAGAAFAWGSPWSRGTLPPGYGMAPGYPGAVDLNLSEDQTKKLQDLSLKYQKEMLELRNALWAKQLELRTLFLSKEPDQAKINSKVEEIGKLRTDIQKKALDYQNQMRKILTPEQWDKLSSYRFFGGRGWRGGWGPLP